MWIDRLPSDSAFEQAKTQDEELAKRQLYSDNTQADDGAPRPPMTEWSPEVRMLAGVNSRLDQLIVALIEINGGKVSKPEPILGPETALERLEHMAQKQNYQSLLDAIDRSPSRRSSDN